MCVVYFFRLCGVCRVLFCLFWHVCVFVVWCCVCEIVTVLFVLSLCSLSGVLCVSFVCVCVFVCVVLSIRVLLYFVCLVVC